MAKLVSVKMDLSATPNFRPVNEIMKKAGGPGPGSIAADQSTFAYASSTFTNRSNIIGQLPKVSLHKARNLLCRNRERPSNLLRRTTKGSRTHRMGAQTSANIGFGLQTADTPRASDTIVEDVGGVGHPHR
ncbi:hypothetical protein HDU81_001005 [Chytriomyces hyalinus]|nr:hypothetical protein HDU81_001005 [Chytriomyces hyalinus]